MKYKIGNIVKINTIIAGDRIDHNSYETKLKGYKGGSVVLSAHYFKHFALIVDIIGKCYLVEYKDKDNRYVRLGFTEDKLTLVKSNNKLIQIY